MEEKQFLIMDKGVKKEGIAGKIYMIRGVQVLIDRDLAALYQVETKVLNQAVKRKVERFPPSFMFQLTNEEFSDWRSQFVTSNGDKMGLRRPPYAFTEQGVAMLSAVLRSGTAIQVSIQIMQAFVEMRRFMLSNAEMFKRIDSLKIRQLQTEKKVDDVLIDNYVDDSVLTLLSKRRKNVSAQIYCKRISKQLSLDLEKHNAQYPPIELVQFDSAHDRFLILDETLVYHIGASLKDLGKKWFAFSKIEKDALRVIEQVKG